MSATRVRVAFEFANGDKNFLRVEKPPNFDIECRGMLDVAAIEKAFMESLLWLLDHHASIQKAVEQKYPGRD